MQNTVFTLLGLLMVFAIAAGFIYWRRAHKKAAKATCIDVDLLRQMPCFSSYSPRELLGISHFFEVLYVPSDVCVITEHERDDSLYYILEGQIDIVKCGSLYDNLLKKIGPKEYFGEMAFLTGSKRIASAKTDGKVCLIRIQKKDFDDVAAKSEAFKKDIWDACDRHTINLCLSDFENLRGLSVAQKDLWVASREIYESGPGDLPDRKQAAYLAVVKGSIVYQNKTYEAPFMMKKAASEVGVAKTTVRLCFLKDPLAVD